MRWIIRKKPQEKTVQKPMFGFMDAAKAKVSLQLLDRRFEEMNSLGVEVEEEITDATGKKTIVHRESYASAIAKKELVASLAQGTIGDRYRISSKGQISFKRLLMRLQHSELKYGPQHPYTKALGKLLFGISFDFINRSIKEEQTKVEIVSLPPEWYLPWMHQGRSFDNLEK